MDFTAPQGFLSAQRSHCGASAPPPSAMADSPEKDVDDADRIRGAIVATLNKRSTGKTACPSEPACDLGVPTSRIRHVAVHMVHEGTLEMTQKGAPLNDPQSVRGPVRLRLPIRNTNPTTASAKRRFRADGKENDSYERKCLKTSSDEQQQKGNTQSTTHPYRTRSKCDASGGMT